VHVSAEDAIVKVKQDQTVAAVGSSILKAGGETLDERVNGTCEEERPKGVTLLNTRG
jgi:hypothetical protein